MHLRLFIPFLLLAAPAWAETVTFNRDIRPILSENCFHCHGPDEAKQEAGLRLDIAGEADLDEVISRITSDDVDLIMPPPDSERSLTPTQIERVKQWIAEGGEYQGHWAFISPTRPRLPDPANRSLAPIDQFVQRKLDEQGFTPAPPASKETLIRRATFDVIGLPPTIDEIDAFLADESPDAYETLIDGLLARKEFGERMASDWLDAARYSDTYGFQVDRDRFVWPWRDWVIDAINDNLSYDQFITQQLAGDLMPPAETPQATRRQILATTFNRLHPQESEGGSVPEEYRIEYVTDRAQTVATAMMGLTYECCRCHNHKYDPISQEEYFQLTAFFDNIAEAGLYSYFTDAIPTPTLRLPTPDQETSLANAETTVAAVEKSIVQRQHRHRPFWKEQIESGRFVDFKFAEPIYRLEFDRSPSGGNKIVEGVDGDAFLLTGDDAVPTPVGNFDRSEPFSVSIWVKTPDAKERAVIFHRSRAWTDAASRGYELLIEDGKLQWSLIHFWPGNAISIKAVDQIPIDQWINVVVTNDGSSRADGLAIFVDGKKAKVDVVRDALTKNITGGGGDTIAVGERFRDRGFKNGSVDRLQVFDVSLTDWEAAKEANRSMHSPGAMLDHAMARHDAELQSLASELTSTRQQKCGIEDGIQEIMVMQELDRPRPSQVLGRGEYSQKGKLVTPGTPAALLPFPKDAPSNRLGLAQWLADPRHPLTSRVAVNRYWQMLFGTGLVRTPEDFGSQGIPPTHPELLDYLAVEFIEGNWDTKAILKQIMTSRTYRQDSFHPDDSVAQSDPDNVWLARFPSYRLPAEMLRDAAIAVSGRLVKRVGGEPARPYEVEVSYKPVDRDRSDGLYRRSVYTYWKRTAPAPVMMTLDASTRDVCRVSRERTASPMQAFVMLNGPQYIEASRGLAEQILRSIPSDRLIEDGIAMAFRTLTSRRPSDDETRLLGELFELQSKYFAADSSRTEAFLKIGDAAADGQLNANALAAMTVVVGTVMNYDGSMVKR
ncbi:Planctomycete cytochrome C [Rubripirellula tenax]|uniref:Planctomycete cytochrome C n=1 Tax=Rubripirellula tenax TaxID=2528015 RepID=A0A5C6FFA8_9BACT|nr:DUF1553 domain-containing protein [Rubripirellula tenax]TWU60496.1 Planctomycete cytochrome C [Rubripirellula tenax]